MSNFLERILAKIIYKASGMERLSGKKFEDFEDSEEKEGRGKMNTEQLAYKISEYRAKYNISGDSDSDWRCAEYIIKNEKDLPLDNDWRGWEKIINYHKI